MKKHQIGLVGYGGMGHWHAELLRDFDRIGLKGVYDIDPMKLEWAVSDGYVAYNSFDEMLADEEIDVILVATPNDFHKDYVVRALEGGKNAISEKPVACSSKEVEEMIAAANRTGKLFTVHQNRRWDEDYRTMKDIYDRKILGDVFCIQSRVHGSRGIPGDWRGKKEHGGGMMLDWGVHIIDQMLQMIPEKVKKVYCMEQHVTNYEVDDGFILYLTFESGLVAQLEVGTSNFINLPRWYMQGENGTAMMNSFYCDGTIVNITNWDKKDAVPVKTAAGLTKTMAPRTDETIKSSEIVKVPADIHDYYENICDVIEGKAEQIVKHHEVLRVMRLMEAAHKSAESCQVVDFE